MSVKALVDHLEEMANKAETYTVAELLMAWAKCRELVGPAKAHHDMLTAKIDQITSIVMATPAPVAEQPPLPTVTVAP